MEQGRVLICDHSKESQQHLRKMLETRGYAVEAFADGAELLKSLAERREERPDLVLLDAALPGTGGLEVLRRLRAARPDIPVIVLSAFATVRGAVEAMKQGACDYLIKPFFADELLALADKEIERNRLLEENRSLKAEIRRRFDPDQVIFRSAAFKRVFDLARKVAPAAAGVLILGESGTGKELIASTIHYSSRRREERFLTVNCAALTETLLESQLFGHIKGAFTGAVAAQRGLVEEAHRGTLFLDEIGDISPGLQAKLLRVLQEKEFLPVGSTRVRHADVRFIAATNRDLEKAVAEGRFREDLFYRLNVATVRVPPLRERREDIAPLAEHFLARFSTRPGQRLTPEALAQLQAHDWPGNARELENLLEMAVILAEGEDIAPEHLQLKATPPPPVEFAMPDAPLPLEEVERMYIEQVFRQSRQHKVRTAEILQISRKTLDRKLREYRIGKDH